MSQLMWMQRMVIRIWHWTCSRSTHASHTETQLSCMRHHSQVRTLWFLFLLLTQALMPLLNPCLFEWQSFKATTDTSVSPSVSTTITLIHNTFPSTDSQCSDCMALTLISTLSESLVNQQVTAAISGTFSLSCWSNVRRYGFPQQLKGFEPTYNVWSDFCRAKTVSDASVTKLLFCRFKDSTEESPLHRETPVSRFTDRSKDLSLRKKVKSTARVGAGFLLEKDGRGSSPNLRESTGPSPFPDSEKDPE